MHYQKHSGRPRPQTNFSEERSNGYARRPRPERSEKRETNQLVFGIRAVMEAIEAGKELESLFVQRGLSGPLFAELKTMLNEHRIPFQQVPIEKLNRLSRKNHQGVIGVISPISYQPLEEIVTGIYERAEVPLLLILDGVTDVRNLGAIARSAECAGVHALIVPSKGSAEINPDAIKTSAGALFKIPVCRVDQLSKTVNYLQESGIAVVAATEKTDKNLYENDYTGPTAFVMGSEEMGVSNDIIRVADHLAKIPLLGEIGSLNVSVATGVVLYEAVRQRGTLS